MFDVPILFATLVGLGAGGITVWFTRRGAAARAEARATALAATISRLTHDIRGALSPALLMAERLERHDDPVVRDAAETISRAMDRAATTCRETSSTAKRQANME